MLDVDSRELAQIASAEFGLPVFDLDALNRELLPEQKIDSELMTKHHAAPLFRRGNRLFVAVSDPTNLNALDEFKFASGINTDAVLVDDKALTKLISDLSDKANGFDANMASIAGGEYDLEIGDGVVEEDEIQDAADDTPIVRFVNKVLLDAIKQGASDIHFEPYEKDYRVRFRTDGILREIVKPPRNLAPRLGRSIESDVTDGHLGAAHSQDGRIK